MPPVTSCLVKIDNVEFYHRARKYAKFDVEGCCPSGLQRKHCYRTWNTVQVNTAPTVIAKFATKVSKSLLLQIQAFLEYGPPQECTRCVFASQNFFRIHISSKSTHCQICLFYLKKKYSSCFSICCFPPSYSIQLMAIHFSVLLQILNVLQLQYST